MSSNDDKRPGRGGARPGAGRKPRGGEAMVTLSIRIPKATKDALLRMKAGGADLAEILGKIAAGCPFGPDFVRNASGGLPPTPTGEV